MERRITTRSYIRGIALIILGVLLLLSACERRSVPLTPDARDGLELLILHSNDTHSWLAGMDALGNACFDDAGCTGGISRMAAAIRSAKARGDNVIALDAGDQFQGTLFYSVHKWPMLARIDEHLPYDAMTLGNHEFDAGCREAAAFTRSLPFPVLAANLTPQQGCPMKQGRLQRYGICMVRGIPVGIVGLANDEVTNLAAACPQTSFERAASALSATVKELEARGVRHIIALTHLGLPADRELARTVEGVDIIVGGHTHSYLGPGSAEGPYPVVERSPAGQPVLVVTAGRAAQYLGELQVTFSEQGVPVRWQGEARELPPHAPRDPAVSALVTDYAAGLEKYRRTEVGFHSLTFPDGMEACRQGDCLGGMIVTDAMLDCARPYGATIALQNGGAFRAALPAGKLTRGHLLTMLPFGGRLVLRKYTGRQIREALEHGASQEHARGPRLLQVAGLRYTVDAARPAGERIQEVMVLQAAGGQAPLDEQGQYGVVMSDYLARGGDGYHMLAGGRAMPFPEPLDVDTVETYIRAHSPLSMPQSGRILWK